jgi:hypothetical protein
VLSRVPYYQGYQGSGPKIGKAL